MFDIREISINQWRTRFKSLNEYIKGEKENSNKVMQLEGPSQAIKMLEKLINHKFNFLGNASTLLPWKGKQVRTEANLLSCFSSIFVNKHVPVQISAPTHMESNLHGDVLYVPI